MGNSISQWFSNFSIKATYDPIADNLKQLYRNNVANNLSSLSQTTSIITNGASDVLGNIPGISEPTSAAFRAIRTEATNLQTAAASMTPDQIAASNDDMTRRYNELVVRAQAEGISPEELEIREKPFLQP